MTSRYWCFTLHPKENQTIPNVLPKDAKYCVYQLETGREGKTHYQGYIEFTNAVRGGARAQWVKEFIPGAHVEVKIATKELARHYCMKPCSKDCDNKNCVEARSVNNGRINWETTAPTELGTWNTTSEQGKRKDVYEMYDMIKNGATAEDIKEANVGLYMRYSKVIQEMIAERSPKRDFKSLVEVHVGHAGTGKSRYIVDTYGDTAYWLSRSKNNVWWNGYKGQSIVAIDDFYGWIEFDYLLKLLDRYPVCGETKGGTVNIAPVKIIITSNVFPHKWYSRVFAKCEEHEAALARRIETIKYYRRGKEPIDITWEQMKKYDFLDVESSD